MFFVRDPNKEKKFVQGCIAWFDDHLFHDIEPNEDPFQLLDSIDGVHKNSETSSCQQGTLYL
jgi:hypothetical protein